MKIGPRTAHVHHVYAEYDESNTQTANQNNQDRPFETKRPKFGGPTWRPLNDSKGAFEPWCQGQPISNKQK